MPSRPGWHAAAGPGSVRAMDDQHAATPQDDPTPYEPPRADDLDSEEAPSVTAAGASNVVGAG